jgi:hypothetical protein
MLVYFCSYHAAIAKCSIEGGEPIESNIANNAGGIHHAHVEEHLPSAHSGREKQIAFLPLN